MAIILIRVQMEFLFWSTGRAVLALVQFADRKIEDGTMKKNKLISPGLKRIKKWVTRCLNVEDAGAEHSPDSTEFGGATIYSGESFRAAKDPEHLPPTNAWQRSTDGLRQFSRILGSPESAFGFRVACATLSIGIVAYLRDTYVFFMEQRLVWAMIMVAIGMTTTAGSGVFGFIGRVAGTGKPAPTLVLEVKLNPIFFSNSYVYKPCHLVNCGWPSCRGARFHLCFHFRRVLLPHEILSVRCCGYDLYRYAR